MPMSRAAAIVNALNVEPAWKPSMPPMACSTLMFLYVWPGPSPRSGRDCAMATMRPVLGWTSTTEPQTGSSGEIMFATAASAESCAVGSMRVWMVRPPRLRRFSRSSRVSPMLGIFIRVRTT